MKLTVLVLMLIACSNVWSYGTLVGRITLPAYAEDIKIKGLKPINFTLESSNPVIFQNACLPEECYTSFEVVTRYERRARLFIDFFTPASFNDSVDSAREQFSIPELDRDLPSGLATLDIKFSDLPEGTEYSITTDSRFKKGKGNRDFANGLLTFKIVLTTRTRTVDDYANSTFCATDMEGNQIDPDCRPEINHRTVGHQTKTVEVYVN
ncbi:MAG TPA: hypothetical protein VNJ01_02225 [Bacteriovoracaceae bacterium]|nr:hypothetical protein [Bacteriovoracaceae bacterium]